jgi:hypothetical protein
MLQSTYLRQYESVTVQRPTVTLRNTMLNIPNSCMAITLIAFMYSVWLSGKRVNVAFNIVNRLVFITEVESVHSAVRTYCFYKADL